ncbi:MAG: phosphatidate cytidylyltransferase [Candidatus Firestonebacteria bacterium]
MIGRLIVAVLFIPLFAWFITLDNPVYYNIVIAFGLFMGLFEYSGMFKKANIKIFTFLNMFFLIAAFFGMAQFRISAFNAEILYRALTLIIIYAVLITVCSIFTKDIRDSVHSVVFSFFGVFYIVMLGSSLFLLKNIGPYPTLFLFAVVWFYDSGAYFIGSRYGKNKLLPLLSPKKTLEGMIGGIIITLAMITILRYVPFTSALVPYNNLFYTYAVVVILCLAAQVGDFLESMLKRYCGVKDSSNLLLGHGGVLDKLDSFLIAAPIYLLLAVM